MKCKVAKYRSVCQFFEHIPCPRNRHPKYTGVTLCFGCAFFEEWERRMDAEDEEIMDEIDEMRRRGF